MWRQNHQVAPVAIAVQCAEYYTSDGCLDFSTSGSSDEDGTKLTVFPPAEAKEKVEMEEVEVAEEEFAPAEAQEMQVAPAEEAPAGLSGSTTLRIALMVILVLVVVAYFLMCGGKKET